MSNNQKNGSGNNHIHPQPMEQPKPERIDEGKTSGRPTPIKK